jgi:predicted nuclease with TOPRIM domain
MTIDEMKNRISMALKNPILQQCFEIICKENAELKKACDETQELLDKQIEATLKLDKENAELKEELKKWKDEWQEQVQKATDEGYARTLQTMQLTKAKELLRYYFDCFKNDNKYTLSDFEVVEDTEQFLNEVENDN